MTTFKYTQGVGVYRDRLIGGMTRRGYDPELAERVFQQIEGFGSYGFPESHAASFAHLAYASSWLKCHHPAVFAAALLNSQPMGFYAPAQIVGDARKHDVEVRPLDINASDWDCTLEPETRRTDRHALRLGLRLASGLPEEEGRLIVKVRHSGNGSAAEQEAATRNWLLVLGGPVATEPEVRLRSTALPGLLGTVNPIQHSRYWRSLEFVENDSEGLIVIDRRDGQDFIH
jgi:DNA polymerase III alpha subunit